MTKPTLYVITCATGAARRLEVLLTQALQAGWDSWVISTPRAAAFIEQKRIGQLSGHAVEFDFRHPDAPRLRPPADAVVVAGASFNTINKWAYGIADNLALSLLNELIGYQIPIALLPFVNEGMASHPVFTGNLDFLRKIGVKVIFGKGIYEPHPGHAGSESLATYPWHLLLQAVAHAKAT